MTKPFGCGIMITERNKQEYRSGHNEAVLKTVGVKAHGGSNPSSCAIRNTREGVFFVGAGRGVRKPEFSGVRARSEKKREGESTREVERRRLGVCQTPSSCAKKSTSFDKKLVDFYSSRKAWHVITACRVWNCRQVYVISA